MQYGFHLWQPWTWGYQPIIGIMIPLDNSTYDSSYDIVGPKPSTGSASFLDMHECTHYNIKGTAFKSNLKRSSDGYYHIRGNRVDELVYLDMDGTRSLAFTTGNRIYGKPGTNCRNVTCDISASSSVVTVSQTYSVPQPHDASKFWYSVAEVAVFMIEKRDGVMLTIKSGARQTSKTAGKIADWSVPPFVYPTLSISKVYSSFNHVTIDQVSEISEVEKRLVMDTIIYRAHASIPVHSEDIVFGDLSQDCADQAQLLDINVSQYFYELTQMKQQVVDTLQLLKGKASAKNLASLYLSAKYGYANTYRDTKAIVDSAVAEMRKHKGMYTCRAQSHYSDFSPSFTFSSWRTSFYQKLYYSQSWNDPLLDGLQTALASSIIPSLSDVWDYLPFSFVVNWFVDINSALEAVDAKTFIATLPIEGVIETRKDFTDLDLGLFPELLRYGISGHATFALYRRKLCRSARLPLARFGDTNPSNHWVEGAALLMQARR